MSRAMNESIDIRPFEQNDQLARHREFLRAQLLARNQRRSESDTMMMSIDSPMGSTVRNSISSMNSFIMEESTPNLPHIEISSPAIPALSSMTPRSASMRSSYVRRRRSENDSAYRGRRRQRRRTGEQQEHFQQMES